jgi:glutamate synthase (NADH)
MSHSPPPFDTLPSPSIPFVEEFAPQSSIDSFHAVQRDPSSWAGAMPASQGLYMNELEKDACGVGFICHIQGIQCHKIVSDARQLLCAMTHRGATGADSRDGDGAGVMTGIPHAFFKREVERDLGSALPEPGEYAVGNIFFKPNDPALLQKHQSIFTKIANDLGLRVLGWREVPTDGSILGPAASSTEPAVLQPFVVLHSHYGDGTVSQRCHFDEKHFERQLYVLRKHTTHSMFVIFYLLCATPELNISDLLCIKYARAIFLRLLLVIQEHCLQGTAIASPSVQLLSRPQPLFVLFALRLGTFPILDEHIP